MSTKNKRIYDIPDKLKVLQEEYEDAGFDAEVRDGCLTVFSKRRKPERSINQIRKSRGLPPLW